MLIHLYFNIGKLFYSFITRRDRIFIILEISGSIFVVLLALFFNQYLFSFFLKISKLFFERNIKIFALGFNSSFYGFLFLVTSLSSRGILPKNPIEVPKAPKNHKKISIGIIDFSWLSMLGLTYTGILFSTSFPIFSETIKKGKTDLYYNLFYNEINYLLGKSIDLIIVLGTILAACMTIIWADQIWRKRDPKSRNDYLKTTLASIKMVIAFFIIIISTIFWISLPLYNKLSSIKNILK